MKCTSSTARSQRAYLASPIRRKDVHAVLRVCSVSLLQCASTSSAGQLILPDSLKLLPIYTMALFKHAVGKVSLCVDLLTLQASTWVYVGNRYLKDDTHQADSPVVGHASRLCRPKQRKVPHG